jgi:hypothetical protein
MLAKSGRGSSEGGFFRKSAASLQSMMVSILREWTGLRTQSGGDQMTRY